MEEDLFGVVDAFLKFKKDLQALCDKLVVQKKYPEHFLVVSLNEGKTVTSITVGANHPVSAFGKVNPAKAGSASGFLHVRKLTSKADLGKVVVDEEKLGLDEALVRAERLLGEKLDKYRSHQPNYGCCHLFRECSAAGKCVHPNALFSSACTYRKNLEAGRNFYCRGF